MEKGKLHYLYIYNMFVSTLFNGKLFFKYIPNKVQLICLHRYQSIALIQCNDQLWLRKCVWKIMGQSQNTVEYKVSSKYSDFAYILDFSKTFFPSVSLYQIFIWLKITHAGMILNYLLPSFDSFYMILYSMTVSTFNITNTSWGLILSSAVIRNFSKCIKCFYMLSSFMLVWSFCKIEIKLRADILKSYKNILFYKLWHGLRSITTNFKKNSIEIQKR